MRLLCIIALLVVSLYGNKILVINSNSSIDKYRSVENAFLMSFEKPYAVLDISEMSKNEIKKYLYDEYPDVIYVIGTKAYRYTNMFVPEKIIFFSSIINYKRLKLKDNRYGISNELHSGMNLTLIKSLFNRTKKLSIVYSDYTQDLYESFKENASLMKIEIIGQKISKNETIDKDILKQTDGFILIADPLLLKNEKTVISLFADMKELKKPIFAYHKLFINLGASLVISAHNPTIGRQIASMIEEFENKQEFTPIQIPMGTKVIFNKKIVDKLDIKYNKKALSVVDEVFE